MESEAGSTPKLCLFSLPSKPPEPPGMLTPPLHTLVSIPFQWEEAPGKPRATTATTPPSKSKTARCLDLPPRLLNQSAKITNMPSPTTVLEGPYAGRSLSQTLSFRIPDEDGMRYMHRKREEKLKSSSWRLGSLREVNGFEFSSSPVKGGSDSKVKITTRVRRSSSFFRFSNTSSNLLASIYKNFKQKVPDWKRKQDKLKKMVP